jgi:MarR family 2-MHQ and catechol resistance regulon transcriptional repressor
VDLTHKYGKTVSLGLGLWVKLARAAATVGKLSAENIRSFGLTEPQFGVLEVLGHLGPQTLGDLSRKRLVSGGNITCVVDNLEREGLVERVHSTTDRRTIVAQLTRKGDALFQSIFPRHADYIASLTGVLSEQEQAELAKLLRKLGLALSESTTTQRSDKHSTHHSHRNTR